MAKKKSISEPTSDKAQKSNEQQKPVPVPLPESEWVFHKVILAERQSNLPIWVRAPKRGPEFYSAFTRSKLYELAAKGRIRSVSIREPGKIRGMRLFHLQSILAFIESHGEQQGSNRDTQ